ncbi:phospholipid phosphatase 1 isoform X4 [Aethina tumida]|uniref:phospholipid phosphatase 1 isoform X4 n=1 Tax=Aethina tumida TaxID=116153 RepID=UPI002147790D|nr:phospholipid phosphatase 1 isoform X4 [Aethina tumida]
MSSHRRLSSIYVKLPPLEINNNKFDNKGMVTPSDGQSQQTTRIDVGTVSNEKPSIAQKKSRCRCRLPRIRPHILLNTLIVVTVCPLLFLLEYGYIPGTKQGFTCKDPQLSHKYNGETITITILFVGTALTPMAAILLAEYLKKGAVRLRDFWFFYKECLVGCCFVLLITEIMKIVVGEHRPHFFAVCNPERNIDCKSGEFIQDYTCSTNSPFSSYFISDTSRSFPSGHSSCSVFAAVFAAYIVQSRIPTKKTGGLLKPLLVSLCLTWGIVCSLTRITDRRHHWWDVFAGALLGAMGAIYTVYYLNKKLYAEVEVQPKMSTSTTTLLDVKNKDATSVII